MTAVDAADVKTFVLSALHGRLTDNGLDEHLLTDDFDLRARGVIDSLGFLQLIGSLESRYGCAISLADVPADRLTVIGVLCDHVAGQVREAGLEQRAEDTIAADEVRPVPETWPPRKLPGKVTQNTTRSSATWTSRSGVSCKRSRKSAKRKIP